MIKYFFYALAGILGITAIGVGLKYLGMVANVATAPARVINKTMETDNIIHNYEWFYDVNAAYDSRLKQVQQFSHMYSTEEDKDEKSRMRIDLAAMQQTCRDLATKYNANSEKMNTSIFKGWSLPVTLSMGACG